MARGPWLLAGVWSAGTAAATTLAWVGAHAVSSAIGTTSVPGVPPFRQTVVTPTGPPAGTPPTSQTATPTTTRTGVSPRTATFSDAGGTITVRCTTDGIELVSASPADGYRDEGGSAGPTRVSVTFLGRVASYRIDARCPGGKPVEQTTVSQSPSRPPPR
ncbi:MAG TPA: hypothetical protein VFW24_08650 [Acidimicrobiales bacterium]|nr:hypothetical protein [Acidimicrobiales bacterium]